MLWGNPLLFFCSLQRLIRLVFFGWNLILGRLKLSVLWLYNGCCGLQGECTTKKWIWECWLVDGFAFTRSFLKQMPHPQPLQARNGNWNITTSLRDTPWPVCCSPLRSMPSTIGVNPWKLMLWQLWRRHAYVGKKAFVQLVSESHCGPMIQCLSSKELIASISTYIFFEIHGTTSVLRIIHDFCVVPKRCNLAAITIANYACKLVSFWTCIVVVWIHLLHGSPNIYRFSYRINHLPLHLKKEEEKNQGISIITLIQDMIDGPKLINFLLYIYPSLV